MTHVCVIGGGGAGCVLALRLARRGLTVTILESGRRYTNADMLDLFAEYVDGTASNNPFRLEHPSMADYRSDGAVHMPINFERVRGLGGTTLFWLGNTPRMLEADFRMRSRFGLAEDWPISYGELEDFYEQAETEIGIAGADDNPIAERRRAPFPMPPIPFSYADTFVKKAMDRLGYELHHTPQARNSVAYDGRSACEGCGYCWVCPTEARATFDVTHGMPAERTGRVRIVCDATVQRLETDGDRTVRRAVYAGAGRIEHAQEADVFVVCGGGIETPRLLLLSASKDFPDGLANRSGMVGKFLMNHPIAAIHGVFEEKLYPYRVQFESSETFQFYGTDRRDEVPGFLMNVNNTGGPVPADYVVPTRLWGDRLARHIADNFGHVASLSGGVEQLPVESNQVRLDPTARDYFGKPVPLITYGFDEYTQRGLAWARKVGMEILTEAGARSFLPDERWWPGHHMGTVRMGDDPSTSVVDRNLRSHDVSNLYLLTTGVWVTGGCANPTLTLAAFALRLAEHLAGG